MTVKIKDLSDLKNALKSRILDDALFLIERKRYQEAIEKINQIKNKNDVPKKKFGIVAETFYQSAKLHQSQGNWNSCIVDLCKTLEYQSNFYLAKERLRLIRKFYSRKSTQSKYYKGTQYTISSDQLQSVELRLFRNNLKINCGIDCKNQLGESPINCAECKGLIKKPTTNLPITDNLDSVHSLGIYRFLGDEKASEGYSRLIRDFKNSNPSLSIYFAQLLSDYINRRTTLLKSIDFLTTVPVDPLRWNERGFNPPGLLAKELSKLICVPFIDNLLVKKDTFHARNQNYQTIYKSFIVSEKADNRVSKRAVLLVDDVTTRGCTLSACASRINEIGSQSVNAIVLAQSETTHREMIKKMYDSKKLASFYQVSQSKYLGPVRFRSLFQNLKNNITSIFDMTDDELLQFKGITKQVVKGIREQADKYDSSLKFMDNQIETAEKCKGGIITIDDPDYPHFLRDSTMCHPILYYKGQIEKFTEYKKSIAIVGSRKASTKSIEIAKSTAFDLAKKQWVIVSGMALGIDSSAHKGALEVNGLTIAVLGCGPDIIYPKNSKELYENISDRGLIISEFPFGTKIEDWKLRKRNKTIVAAALGAFVVESSSKGGAMNAVKACQEQKKKIFTLTSSSTFLADSTGNERIQKEIGGKGLNPDKTSIEIETALSK